MASLTSQNSYPEYELPAACVSRLCVSGVIGLRSLRFTRNALDGFLKAHGVFEPYSLDDLARERHDLEKLEF
jgi:hypothetical protein